MSVSLHPLDNLRFQITADGQYAGGITVHSCSGTRFSYGIAVPRRMRGHGIAGAALALLFEIMKNRGYDEVRVTVHSDNAASLRLHRKMGFRECAKDAGVITLERYI